MIAVFLILVQPVLSKPHDDATSREQQNNLSTAQKSSGQASSKRVNGSKPKMKVRSRPTRDIVNLLVAWIVAKTGWKKRNPLPKVVERSSAHLMKIYYGKYYNPNSSPVYGFYVLTTHTIYLLDTWDANKLRDRGILLHELIHHLQNLNKRKYDCPEMAEGRVYELHFQWLKDQGIKNPQQFLQVDDLALLMLRQCSE